MAARRFSTATARAWITVRGYRVRDRVRVGLTVRVGLRVRVRVRVRVLHRVRRACTTGSAAARADTW